MGTGKKLEPAGITGSGSANYLKIIMYYLAKEARGSGIVGLGASN